jgi:hypothetical protein
MRLEIIPMIVTPILLSSLITALPVAVEGESESSRICIPEGTKIYSPADAGVKGPKLQIETAPVERLPKVRSRVVFEVLVNSTGRICDIQILKAPDRETALRVGHYVGDYFRFTPASLKGRPVAARLKLVLDEHGTVSVER